MQTLVRNPLASHLHNLNKDFEDAADRQEADDKEKIMDI